MLKAKLESTDLELTTLTLIIKPKEVQLGEALEVLGQVVTLSESAVEMPENTTIKLSLVSPAGEAPEFEVKTTQEGNYQLAVPFKPDEVGEWEIKASLSDTRTLKGSERTTKFKVDKGNSVIAFSNADSALLGSEIELVGILAPELSEQPITLKMLKPDGSVATLTDIKSSELGIFKQKVEFNLAGNWDLTATWSGNDSYESVTKTLTVNVTAEVGKAIIVLGGGSPEVNSEWKTFSSVASYVHNAFLKRQFKDEDDIQFLSPSLSGIEGADTVTTLETLEKAITDWAKKKVNSKVPLYIYLLSHNLGDKFLLEKTDTKEKYLSPQLLDTWLETLPGGNTHNFSHRSLLLW
ncbi:hypothetical protein CMK12_00150 [Candidatus Poribacteria bacterium]|nr:hypothetical protein [Candidatus Poribacteria bacterium]